MHNPVYIIFTYVDDKIGLGGVLVWIVDACEAFDFTFASSCVDSLAVGFFLQVSPRGHETQQWSKRCINPHEGRQEERRDLG